MINTKNFAYLRQVSTKNVPVDAVPHFIHAQVRNDLPIRFINENGHICRGQTSPQHYYSFSRATNDWENCFHEMLMPIVSSRIIESRLSCSVFTAPIRYHIGIHQNFTSCKHCYRWFMNANLHFFQARFSECIDMRSLSSIADFTCANEVSACR